MIITLALTESIWSEFSEALDSDLETAWMMTARMVDTGEPSDSLTLVARTLFPVPASAYEIRQSDRLSIANTGWLPVFGRAEIDSAIPIFIHTHPGSSPHPSSADDEVHSQLLRVANFRNSISTFVSLVVGGTASAPAFSGRFSDSPDSPVESINFIRISGKRLHHLEATTGNAPLDDLTIFNRQILAFGEEGQRILKRLKVGIVGLGGTGSAVCEQLVRLGVGELVVIDPQNLEDTNVTRVYGSHLLNAGKAKTEVARKNTESIGLGTRIHEVKGKVTSLGIAESLAQCDVIFGCTDDHAGRAILTRMPLALLNLLIDCGVKLDSRELILHGIFGRVSIVEPSTPCLVCLGDVDPVQVRNDLLPEDERVRLQAEGYAPELNVRDPAVVTFTTLVASMAVNELLSRLFGYPDVHNRYLIRIHDREISRLIRTRVGNHRCGNKTLLGTGLETPYLDWSWEN